MAKKYTKKPDQRKVIIITSVCERERENDEESMRIGKERKSPWKTDVPKLYAYNECKQSVSRTQF